jgi:pimeloyl-ACP methyl ester carboxylesterase
MKKIVFFFIFFLLVLGIMWAVQGLSDFDLSAHDVRAVSFIVDNSVVSGTLVLPHDLDNPPIALIIHGDGPQDRFSGGGYFPIINTLLDAGIGVFTWDKPGIGGSAGNWLNQTMDNRATEALAARQAIAEFDTIDIDQIGFLGFSQAGWVLPRIAKEITPAFSIIIGGAVSWRDQGTYYNRVRMTAEGIDPNEITHRLADRTANNDVLFSSPIVPTTQVDMDSARLRFVGNAYWENSTDDISSMQGPVLAIWGEQDLNVDALTNAAIFKEQLTPLTDKRTFVIVPNATHSLLRADLFNYQLSSDWPWHREYLFLGMGRDAFAPQSLNLISEWIKKTVE